MKLFKKVLKLLNAKKYTKEVEEKLYPPEINYTPVDKINKFKIEKKDILCSKKLYDDFIAGLNSGFYRTDMPLISTDEMIVSMIKLVNKNECYKTIKVSVSQPRLKIIPGDLSYTLDDETAVDIDVESGYNKLDPSQRSYMMNFKVYRIIDICGVTYTCSVEFSITATADVTSITTFESMMQKGLYDMFLEILTKYSPVITLFNKREEVAKLKIEFDNIPAWDKFEIYNEDSIFKTVKKYSCRLNTSLRNTLGVEK